MRVMFTRDGLRIDTLRGSPDPQSRIRNSHGVAGNSPRGEMPTMKRTHGRSSGCGNAGGWIAALGLLAAGLAPAQSNYPPWWATRQVVNTNASPQDFAPATQGQAKWIAKQAYEELDLLTNVTNAQWTSIVTMVSGFTTNDNYLPLNQGQLKNLAKPFYDFLYEIGWSNAVPPGMPGLYPWTTNTTDDLDYAPVNLGQLKYVFSFNLGDAIDSDGDGLTDQAEYALGTNPNNPDSDNDGMWDGWEVAGGLNPLVNDATGDPDGDGYSNLQEYLLGMRPNVPATVGALGLCVVTPLER